MSSPAPSRVPSRVLRRTAAEAALSVALAGVALLALPVGWALLPVAYLAAVTPALVRIDLAEHRLPDRLTLPGYPVALLGVVGATVGGVSPWLPLAVGGAYLGVLLVAHLAGGMGFGDVKLAGVLGTTLGLLGPDPALAAPVLAVLTGGAVAVVVLLRRRRDTRIAFGPYLLLGFWLALFWAR